MSWQERVPKSDTAPEMTMRRILEQLKVPFISQEPVKTRYSVHWSKPDFMVRPNFLIYVDGEYWHRKKRRAAKDEAQENCLLAEGFFRVPLHRQGAGVVPDRNQTPARPAPEGMILERLTEEART